MKNLILFTATLLCFTNAFAEKTILCGHFDREAESTITLQYEATVLDQIERNKTFVEGTLDKNNNFKLSFDIDHPVRINVMNGKKWLFYNIFICPGDSIYMTYADSTISIEGKGEKQFGFCFEHQQKFMSEPTINKEFNSSHRTLESIPYAEYWKQRKDGMLAYMNEYFKDTIISPDFKKYFEYQTMYYSYAVPLSQYAWRRSKDYQYLFADKEYLKFFDEVDMNNPEALNLGAYSYFLREFPYAMFTSNINHANDDDPANKYWYENQPRLRDSIAKAYFTGEVYDMALYIILHEELRNLSRMKGSDYFDTMHMMTEQLVATLGKGFNNDTLLGRLERKLADFKMADQPAPDFTAFDKGGKEVKLSDFKGKVVYAEFWSTTCVPCIKELPDTKELQAHYKGNDDLVFLYISFDNSQDKAKEFIKRKEFTGTHLFAPKGFLSEAANKYKITGIPRFIVVNKEGNLVTNDAPRPSHNPKELLDSLLKK